MNRILQTCRIWSLCSSWNQWSVFSHLPDVLACKDEEWIESGTDTSWKGHMKVMPLICFSKNVITIIVKFTCMIGTLCTSWDYFFTKSPSLLAHFFHVHYQHIFSIFAWGVVHWSCNTLCWSVRALHEHCVAACRHLQNSVFGVHPSGG